MAITKDKDEQPHLSLLMAVGSASGLNSGMQCPDRDDIFALGRIRTSLLRGSLVSIEEVHPDWEDHLQLFFSRLITSVTSYEDQPADALDAYETREAFRKLKPKFVELCTALPVDDTDDTKSPPTTLEPEQSSEEDNEEPPSPRALKGNKHSHVLPSFWFVTPSALNFRKYASASICKVITFPNGCHNARLNPLTRLAPLCMIL